MNIVLSFFDNARIIFNALGSGLSLCILIPFGIFLLVVTSMFFIAFATVIYSLLQPLFNSVPEEESSQKPQNETPNNTKKIFTAFITFIAAVGTLLIGIGTFQSAQQAKRANDFKQQEIQIVQQKLN